jgi:hypothetical protein
MAFTFEARRRIVSAVRNDGVNGNVVTNYSYGQADNDLLVTTAGAPK